MKIGLIDVDGHNGFPNLALMRISAWHKARGDDVQWWFGFDHYDIVYISKVFSAAYSDDAYTPPNADIVIRGGSGYAIRTISGVEIYDPAADIQRMDTDVISLLNRCKIPRYRFAWDDPSVDLTDQFARVGDALRTKSRSAKMVYVLANFGSSTPDDVLFRIYILRSLNYDPYVMIYDKPNAQQIYLDLQRWCNNKIIFGAVEFFEDYNRM